jgi:hypothetical protein
MNSKGKGQSLAKPVDVQLGNKATVPGKFIICLPDPDDRSVVRVKLQFSGREISYVAKSCIFALDRIRADLETDGILLRCYGSSRNVLATGISGSMGAGMLVYRCYLGKRIQESELVSIFHSGPDIDPCTLQEQREFRKLWRASVGLKPEENLKKRK